MNDKQLTPGILFLERIFQKVKEESAREYERKKREYERKRKEFLESIKCPECRCLWEASYLTWEDAYRLGCNGFPIFVSSCLPCEKREKEKLERMQRETKYQNPFNNVYGGMTQ